MKRIIVIALFTILLLLGGCSDSKSTITDTTSKSFLWKVDSESSTVYILGSIHVADQELYPLDNAIETAFDQSQNLAVEFDIVGADQSYMTKLLMQKGAYSGGETLHDNIPKSLYKQADEILEDMGGDIFLFNTFEPWVVAMTIEELIMKEYGYTGEYGIDKHFLNMAHDEGKDIIELESAEFQITLFDELSNDLQVFLLQDIVENLPTKKELEKLYDAWEEGDSLEMEALIMEGVEDSPELQMINKKLLDERNFLMVEKIEGFLQNDETYFVVVGAGHLIGENGIINLLKGKGYTPTQL